MENMTIMGKVDINDLFDDNNDKMSNKYIFSVT